MAGRRARTDLHQLRRGAPLRRAGAALAAARSEDRPAPLSPRPLHAGPPHRRRPARRGQGGAGTLKRRPDWRALGRALAARRWPLLLLAVAAAPFLPGAVQFVRHGVTDVMFPGGGAVLELRTWHAAHGRQLLGPYSRFQWSHPGPAFFYLSLPIYQLFHQRGPALNLFVLLANFAAATALVLTARRLRGDLCALVVAVLLAVYETIGAPFPLSGEWNPMTPILPLALLVFLCVRLGSGAVGVLPGVAFVASAIVQTHVGFTPAALYLVTTGTLFGFRELFVVRGAGGLDRRRLALALGATAVVSSLLWALPVYEDLSRPEGNLH